MSPVQDFLQVQWALLRFLVNDEIDGLAVFRKHYLIPRLFLLKRCNPSQSRQEVDALVINRELIILIIFSFLLCIVDLLDRDRDNTTALPSLLRFANLVRCVASLHFLLFLIFIQFLLVILRENRFHFRSANFFDIKKFFKFKKMNFIKNVFGKKE